MHRGLVHGVPFFLERKALIKCIMLLFYNYALSLHRYKLNIKIKISVDRYTLRHQLLKHTVPLT